MWTTEHTAETPLPPEAVWAALRALHEGRLSYDGADEFALHGPFAVGTRVSVTPEGQETFDSTIVDLVENSTYADETVLGKRAGKDAERNKATLVAALGLAAAHERRDRLAAEAVAALDQFPQGRKAVILKEAARFAVARKN